MFESDLLICRGVIADLEIQVFRIDKSGVFIYHIVLESHPVKIDIIVCVEPSSPKTDISTHNITHRFILVSFIEAHMKGIPIGEQEFYNGAWIARIPELLAMPRNRSVPANGTDEVATYIGRSMIARTVPP